jgi:alkanesulfonate monooxygenase SsuD/methylene tetrahydromethanopterin reductase-like flavin-dependent oxidoreductase (luciferase family)
VDLRIFTEPHMGARYDDILRVARAAEDGGYDGFFRSDHYLRFGGGDPLPGPTDAWTTLAGLARDTKTIRLGTLMTAATFRLPGPLAITVAQVDQMSGGRVELGIGTGWFAEEHTAYGIPFPPLGERFDRLEEQLAVITGLWATPAARPSTSPASTTRSATPRRCPSRSSSPARRSCSVAWDRSGRPASPPGTPTSSTCRSPRSRTRPRSSSA